MALVQCLHSERIRGRLSAASAPSPGAPADATVRPAADGQAMPGLSGLELTDAVSRITPTCPGVLLTGHTDVELPGIRCRRGASDFVTKP